MALNDIGINVIERASQASPLATPAEIGILGIAGQSYRGVAGVLTHIQSEEELYIRFGSEYDNYGKNLVFMSRGHVRNTGDIGSDLYLVRTVAADAVTAHYPTSLVVGTTGSYQSGNGALRVNQLSSVTSDINISHGFDSNSGTYKLILDTKTAPDADPVTNPNGGTFVREIYMDDSLENIANSINNGGYSNKLVVQKVTTDITTHPFVNNSLTFTVATGETDITSTSSTYSSLCGVDVVTQSYVPITGNFTTLVTSSVTTATPSYNVPVTSTNNLFYVLAGQLQHEDKGIWGNNVSITISSVEGNPTHRNIQISYKNAGITSIVEEFTGDEQSCWNFLTASNYCVYTVNNTYNYIPFVDGVTLALVGGSDGTSLTKSEKIGSSQAKTGVYAFEGSPVTSITCADIFSVDTDNIELFSTYETVAAANNMSALFCLPYQIAETTVNSVYTKNLMKTVSKLALYKAFGKVSDGRNGYQWIPMTAHIHGAAYVRWRLSKSNYPNIPPKGENTYLADVYGLDRETWSQSDITTYVRQYGVNPVALTTSGFTVQSARTMSRNNVDYSIHVLELMNFFKRTLYVYSGFLMSELNTDDTNRRFRDRILTFGQVLNQAGCLETDGGFDNNFKVQADINVTTIQQRRQRVFNAIATVRWVEQIETANIFVTKTDEGIVVK